MESCLAETLKQCWNADPKARPSFNDIVEILKEKDKPSSRGSSGIVRDIEPLDSFDLCLRYPCGCKRCSIHKFCEFGCPNPDMQAPVPVLGETVSTDASLGHFTLEAQREHETMQMMTSFANLVDDTCKFMTKKVTVKTFALWLKQLSAFTKAANYSDSTPAVLTQQITKIEQAGSMVDVFRILSDYWSWFNHYLVEEIINHYGDEEDKRRLDDFKKHFFTFAELHIVQFSQHRMAFGTAVDDSNERIALLFKIGKVWDDVHINQLSKVHRNVASILQVKPHTIYLVSIQKGCILMKFLVSHSVVQAVFPLSSSQKEDLAAIDIMLVECGPHCYKFLPILQEGVADGSPQSNVVVKTQYWADVGNLPESSLDSVGCICVCHTVTV
jgi:hypothetical protein